MLANNRSHQSSSNHVDFITDALYDYTLYVRGAYNGPYIRIKHHTYVRAYNHRITNGQRIIPSYDETEFTPISDANDDRFFRYIIITIINPTNVTGIVINDK